jgi:hypothetical protein
VDDDLFIPSRWDNPLPKPNMFLPIMEYNDNITRIGLKGLSRLYPKIGMDNPNAIVNFIYSRGSFI